MGGLAGLSGLSGLSGEFGGGSGGGGGGGSALTDAVAYYLFEDGSDATLRGNDLTVNNSPAFAAGLIGNAIGTASSGSKWASSSGTSDQDLGGLAEWSISVWFKITATPNRFSCILAKGPDSGSQEYRLLWDNTFGRLSFEAYGISNTYTVAVADGAWHHAVMFKASGSGDLSLIIDNGSAQVAAADLGSSGSGVFGVGGQDTGLYIMTGQIDSLGIYKFMLSGGQIAALYNSGAGMDPAF